MWDAFVIAFVVLAIANGLFRRRATRFEMKLKRVMHMTDSQEQIEKLHLLVAVLAVVVGAAFLAQQFI